MEVQINYKDRLDGIAKRISLHITDFIITAKSKELVFIIWNEQTKDARFWKGGGIGPIKLYTKNIVKDIFNRSHYLCFYHSYLRYDSFDDIIYTRKRNDEKILQTIKL